MTRLRIVVVGTLAGNPCAGLAWMHMQIAAGFRRLGHDAYYFEFTSDWPFDPVRQMKVCSSDYAVPYLAHVCGRFGLENRWAYRRSYADHAWFGMTRAEAEYVLASADLVLNVAGATRVGEERLEVRRWIYYGTDPVVHEIAYAREDATVRALIDEHDEAVTCGENIGTIHSLVPPLPRLKARTRQPVLMDEWSGGIEPRQAFTTVSNWEEAGLDLEFRGETYRWSRRHEFLKFVDLPRRTSQPLEIAIQFANRLRIRPEEHENACVAGQAGGAREVLESHGWRVADGAAVSTDPWRYRDYIISSRAEFTVARDLTVRPCSGWFSERNACYLAAGRPVVTQDTGFGRTIPTGEGLFAFNSMDEILAAVDAINSDYARHSRAAREIARDYFATERVLPRLLDDLGSQGRAAGAFDR